MTVTGTKASRLRDLQRAHGVRALKYASVSVVGVAVTQVLLFITLQLLDWSPTWSNFVAVSGASVPAYLLNRQWVWAKSGRHSMRREVLPFWGVSLLGLLLSTVAVAVVSGYSTAHLVVAATNIASFGVLWVGKYVFLDKLMFGPGQHDADDLDAGAVSRAGA
ncbi:MAG: GtrA family protein [Acidimicrobiia bacterium]|nr:GtrA family protein [Acidimicrobiia bacterium]